MSTHHTATGGTHNHHDDIDPIDQQLAGGRIDPAWRVIPVEYVTLNIPSGATEQEHETALFDYMERAGRRRLDELG